MIKCGCTVKGLNDNVGWHMEIDYCPLHAAAPELLEACQATDTYFKSLLAQWAANDGRVVSDKGTVIEASAFTSQLCDEAGIKIRNVLDKLERKA